MIKNKTFNKTATASQVNNLQYCIQLQVITCPLNHGIIHVIICCAFVT